MKNMQIWDVLKRPPESALKPIQAGRLKGKSDISPQWRMQAMTEQFGPVGDGWKYEIYYADTAPGADGEVAFFVGVDLYYRKEDGEWSEAIPGVGGSMLVANENRGPYTNDEAYKMALTDALSVAMKALGMAADIYLGLFDGSKYRDAPENGNKKQKTAKVDLSEAKEKTIGFLAENETVLNEEFVGIAKEDIEKTKTTDELRKVYLRIMNKVEEAKHVPVF